MLWNAFKARPACPKDRAARAAHVGAAACATFVARSNSNKAFAKAEPAAKAVQVEKNQTKSRLKSWPSKQAAYVIFGASEFEPMTLSLMTCVADCSLVF